MHTPNPEKLWYYSSQGNNVGPVTYDDFKSAANSGKVDRFQDRAWCDALPDWIAVSEIEGLFSSPPPPSPGPLGVAPLSRSVRPLDGSIRPVVLPGKGPVSVTLMTVLYSVAIGLYVVGGIITALGQLEQSFELTVVGLVLLIPSVVCLIWFMVLHLKAVHRLWSYIPDGYRRTTPGKAIGFLFIPTFNLYWIFQAYWGLAKDYNQWRQADPTAPKLKEGLFLTQCILTACAIVPFVNLVAMIPTIVLAYPVFRQVGHAVNELDAKQTN